MDKFIRALQVFSPFYPVIITWLLQMKFKFDKAYIWVVFCLSFAVGAYYDRADHFYHRGGAPGIKIEPEQMVMVSVCFTIMAIWQYVIICKNRNKKNEPES